MAHHPPKVRPLPLSSSNSARSCIATGFETSSRSPEWTGVTLISTRTLQPFGTDSSTFTVRIGAFCNVGVPRARRKAARRLVTLEIAQLERPFDVAEMLEEP